MEKTISLADLYRELKNIEQSMVTKAELESALETISILSNEETMRQLEESESDIRAGKFKKIESVEDI